MGEQWLHCGVHMTVIDTLWDMGLSTVWILGAEVRLSDLVAGDFTQWPWFKKKKKKRLPRDQQTALSEVGYLFWGFLLQELMSRLASHLLCSSQEARIGPSSSRGWFVPAVWYHGHRTTLRDGFSLSHSAVQDLNSGCQGCTESRFTCWAILLARV